MYCTAYRLFPDSRELHTYIHYTTTNNNNGHVVSKSLLQQDPPVLNWGCWLTQVVLHNGRMTVVGSSSSSSGRNEYDLSGTIALLVQDHRTVSTTVSL